MDRWDDLRLLLVISKSASLLEASRSAGLDATTLGRRIRALEDALGARLVHRSREGATLTPVGRRVLAHAEAMERAARAADEVARGDADRPEGRVVLATTEVFAQRVLIPALPALVRAQPGIELEVRAANATSDLTGPDVDLAVRVVSTSTPSLLARRVGSLRVGLYGTRAMLARRRPSLDDGLDGWSVLGYGERLAESPEARWLRRCASKARVVLRQDSVLGTLAATRAGLGLGLLPRFVGDVEPSLRRVDEADPGITKPIWLLKNRQLARVARVQVVWDFALNLLESQRAAFEG
jgi:DNA-binding transcriptional LysR family regulator